MFSLDRFVGCLILYLLCLCAATAQAAPALDAKVALGISADGRFFTLNGRPTFLQGMSYYGAESIADPAAVTADLDDLAAEGFNWIRVWAFWSGPGSDPKEDVSVLTPDGQVREPYMSRLKTLLTECNRRGIVVDVTIPFDGKGEWVGPRNPAEHLAVVRKLAAELKPWRNAYIDVGNERDVRDARYVSLEEVGRLIDAIKVIDSQRLCTASSAPDSAGRMRDFLRIGKMDFIAPHLSRDEDSAGMTVGEVDRLVGWMDEIGRRVPIHLQEPFRRGYNGYNPSTDDFLRDCSGAKIAEAAGWCLHNGSDRRFEGERPWRSFNMNAAGGRLYKQLDEVELAATARLTDCLAGVDLGRRRYQAEYPEQLAHQVGRREGDAWVAGEGDKAGFMSYGPYIKTIPAGKHVARWRLRIDGDIPADATVFTIDVTADGGKKTLASRQITRADFADAGQWAEFELPFASDAGDALELRTFWHDQGQAALDWIELDIQPDREHGAK